MKNKKVMILISIGILSLFVYGYYGVVSAYYAELLGTTGLSIGNVEFQATKENEQALENERSYQELLLEEDAAEGVEESQEIATPPKSLKLNALSSLLLDGTNNRVLYEENGYKRLPMASTTKIMSCIVAIENGKLDDVVTVSAYAATMPDVQLNIRKGEQYYLGDLLYSLMLESHNDVAVAIAEHIGGSVEGFAAMMNEKARSLECNDTNFVTPSGLDSPEHYTTARDLAVIASYAIQNEKFVEVINTPLKQFKEITKGKAFTVTTKNRFLYMMEGALGIKTGFTNGAGYCFVGAVKKLDRTLVSVVLGSGWPPNKNLKWSDTKALMNYGIDNYKTQQIFVDQKLDPVLVAEGTRKYVNLNMEGNISLLLREDEKVRIDYQFPEVLVAPVQSGIVIGHAKYYINDQFYTEVPIYTLEAIEKINFGYCIRKLLGLWSLSTNH